MSDESMAARYINAALRSKRTMDDDDSHSSRCYQQPRR